MIIGSHNAWSFLRPRKWWMRLIGFTARCQRLDISLQRVCGSLCFDLHVRFDDNGDAVVVHGPVEYALFKDIRRDICYLDFMKDSFVRVILDTRTKKQFTDRQKELFYEFCMQLEMFYPNIKFWCGRNLYNWNVIYSFQNDPTCVELYGSVTKPKWLWGWWPWFYASGFNGRNISQGTNKNIMLIDFVDIN